MFVRYNGPCVHCGDDVKGRIDGVRLTICCKDCCLLDEGEFNEDYGSKFLVSRSLAKREFGMNPRLLGYIRFKRTEHYSGTEMHLFARKEVEALQDKDIQKDVRSRKQSACLKRKKPKENSNAKSRHVPRRDAGPSTARRENHRRLVSPQYTRDRKRQRLSFLTDLSNKIALGVQILEVRTAKHREYLWANYDARIKAKHTHRLTCVEFALGKEVRDMDPVLRPFICGDYVPSIVELSPSRQKMKSGFRKAMDPPSSFHHLPKTSLKTVIERYAVLGRVKDIRSKVVCSHPGAILEFCMENKAGAVEEFLELQRKRLLVLRLVGRKILDLIPEHQRAVFPYLSVL